MAKFTRTDFIEASENMEVITRRKFGDYGFSVGVYSQILATIFVDLPKHKQAEILKNLNTLSAKYAPAVEL